MRADFAPAGEEYAMTAKATVDNAMRRSPQRDERPRTRPDPEARTRSKTIISVDDHVMEPPDLFEGRLPDRYAGDPPRVVEADDGTHAWLFEGDLVPVTGVDALMSWEPDSYYLGPVRFDEVRPAMWNVDERVRDMDIAGVAASLCFPSTLFGFAGQRLSRMKDRGLGLSCVRAYNDWIAEEWAGRRPDRMIPSQITWPHDPHIAAEEVRRNAERGFKAVTFSENPEKLGFSSLYTGYWDPFFMACEETETVVNLHIGSSQSMIEPSSDAPLEVVTKLFTLNAMMAVLEWIYAKIPVRHPNIKIVMAEAGVGWVPWLIDRIDYAHSQWIRDNGDPGIWGHYDLSPSEVLMRNFWFSSFYDPKGFRMWDMMEASRLMVEVDYPHADSNWPDCQQAIAEQLDGLPDRVAAQISHENAAALYRHPVPAGF
jgi:predicted TIM-barrel fold metal-dependent hydrolase